MAAGFSSRRGACLAPNPAAACLAASLLGGQNAEEPDWRYDAHGLTRLSRDSLHRVYRVEYPTVNGIAGPSVSVQQDEFGRVTQQSDGTGTTLFAYDDLNRVVTATPPVGRAMTYQYLPDPVNQRWITREILAGVGTYEYREDPKGRVNEQYNPLGQWTGFQYAATGHLLKEQHANGTWTDYAYTPRLWPEVISHYANSGALVDRLWYQYDDGVTVDHTGRIRRETDLQGRVHAYGYNPLGELTGESHPDFGTLTYTYDAAGNRKSKSNGSVTEYYGHDTQNKLLWANQGGNSVPTTGQAAPYRLYSYDGAGFPTTVERGAGGSVANDILSWDGVGNLRRLQTIGAQTGDYLADYDGSGDRTTATINGLQHIYSGDLFDEAGNTLFTPGISENSEGQDRFYQSDHLGSTRYLSNTQGTNQSIFRYDAFGSRSAQSGTADTKFGFAGGFGYQSDGPAGLQLLGLRYYDPLMGRFISPDPIGFDGGLNLYAYCDDDPVNGVDPSGLGPSGLIFGDADGASDADITNFGKRFTKRLVGAPFHTQDMAYANEARSKTGYGRFGFGNRAVGNDLLHIWEWFGMPGAGGPEAACTTGIYRAGSSMRGGLSWWDKLKYWGEGILRRGRSESNLPERLITVYHKGDLVKGGGRITVSGKLFSTSPTMHEAETAIAGAAGMHRLDIPESVWLQMEKAKAITIGTTRTKSGDQVTEIAFSSRVQHLLEQYRTKVR